MPWYSLIVSARLAIPCAGRGLAVFAFESKTSAPMPSVRRQIRSSRIDALSPATIETTLSFTVRLPISRPQ